MKSSKSSVSRGLALKGLAALPFAALAVGAVLSPAQAADNKKQFKYQDKPGPHGQKCAGCKLFIPPNKCKIVTGNISPNGWCVAWVKK
ncbi:MAG: iro [Candidatus Eremiobacteraeota bacterium]|jgi:hypothetical protein|nr:iro [Candidatus Eremiobacteraeota bacterium]